jgi:Sedlin, N-terminal conserved region
MTIPKLIGLAVIGKQNEPLYLCDCERLVDGKVDDSLNSSSTGNDPFGLVAACQKKGAFPPRDNLSYSHQLIFQTSLDAVEDMLGTLQDTHRFIMASSSAETTTSNFESPVSCGLSISSAGTVASVALSHPVRGTIFHHHLQLRLPPQGTSNAVPPGGSETSGETVQQHYWLGLLLREEKDDCALGSNLEYYEVFGSMTTSTNIKFLALIQSTSNNGDDAMARAAATMRGSHGSIATTSSSRAIQQCIESFLIRIQQAYVEYVLNPWNGDAAIGLKSSFISSKLFDERVRQAVHQYHDGNEEASG